jgi:hypothetical protein
LSKEKIHWKRNHFGRGNIEYLVPSVHAKHNFVDGKRGDLLLKIVSLISS